MDCVGLDLHKRESQLCILTETGEVIEQDTVPGQIGPLGWALEPAVWIGNRGSNPGGAASNSISRSVGRASWFPAVA